MMESETKETHAQFEREEPKAIPLYDLIKKMYCHPSAPRR